MARCTTLRDWVTRQTPHTSLCTRLGPASHTPHLTLCRYKALYVTHVENKLWRRAGLQKYEESLPFDKPDIDHELPKFLAAEYPGLQAASVGDVPPITYANVYERICHNDLKPVLAELEREYGDEVHGAVCDWVTPLHRRLPHHPQHLLCRHRATAPTSRSV